MTPNPPYRTALLFCAAVALAACQSTTERSVRQKPKRAESLPSKVATRAAGAQAGAPAIVLSGAEGQPGDVVSISATLNTAGAPIAGTQSDIVYDPAAVSIARSASGQPECAANRALGKDATAFSFVPKDCGTACRTVRALVLSLSNVEPIANGSTLFTCRVRIADRAKPGTYRLNLTRVGFSDPQGGAINGSAGDGSVTVR